MKTTILSLAPLAFLAGCAFDPSETETETGTEPVGTTAEAITPIPIPDASYDPGAYAITPIPIPGKDRPIDSGTFTADANGIYYLSARNGGYTAVKIDPSGNLAAESQWIAGSVPSRPTNMVPDGGALVFGVSKSTQVMPFNPLVKPTTRYLSPDPSAPEVHGNGLVPLPDGSSADVFTVRGFAKASKIFPTPSCGSSAYACTNVVSDATPGHRGFWAIGDHTLKNTALGDTSTTTTASCDLGDFTTYAPDAPITSAKDAPTGYVHVATRLSQGKVVECTGALGAGTVRVLALPFKGTAGDLSFDNGGGKTFDASTTTWTGLWVASTTTPEVAYFPGGGTTAVKLSLTTAAPGTAAYTAAFPQQIVTVGTRALVLTADHRLVAITRRW